MMIDAYTSQQDVAAIPQQKNKKTINFLIKKLNKKNRGATLVEIVWRFHHENKAFHVRDAPR